MILSNVCDEYLKEVAKLKNKKGNCELIKPTCKVIDILKPIYNFKASDEVRFKKN